MEAKRVNERPLYQKPACARQQSHEAAQHTVVTRREHHTVDVLDSESYQIVNES